VLQHNFRGLVGHSKGAERAWNNIAGSFFPQFCDTRWWSEYEEAVYMFVHTNHRDNFILEGYFGEFSKSVYVKNLYEYTHGAIDDGVNWILAELELVAVAEGARPFVQAFLCLIGMRIAKHV
jgi:hypothetical protein